MQTTTDFPERIRCGRLTGDFLDGLFVVEKFEEAFAGRRKRKRKKYVRHTKNPSTWSVGIGNPSGMPPKPRKNKPSGPAKEWSPLELAEMKTGKYLGQIHRPKGFASRRRIKPEKGTACYHVMSRTVNGDFLFGAIEKEAFRRMMWRMAKFSGVEIFT